MMYIVLIGLMFGIIGILQLLYPEKTYMFLRRWMYKEDHVMSELAILFVRGEGLILIGFSIYVFYSVIADLLLN